MAHNALFKRTSVEKATAKNYAGGDAYTMEARAALAQLAVTGCFNNTYYTTAEAQLDQVLTLSRQVEPEFLAKIAIYARESGFMKDMPAALIAALSGRDAVLCRKAFSRVINNGKMLRNFVQMIRSGVFGRKNVSSVTMKRMIQSWFDSKTDEQVFFQSVGSNPSFGDIIKMARVRPNSHSRSALYAHLIGKKEGKFNDLPFVVAEALPPLVAAYEAYKVSPVGELPKAPFEMLMGLQLTPADWKAVATTATWTQTFKSLNTFSRQGVFKDPAMVELIASKLQNEGLIVKSNVFPYQILMAYKATTDRSITYRSTAGDAEFDAVPPEIASALGAALEIATRNVPAFEGLNVYICPDVSGSMSSGHLTGNRKGSTSQVLCIDVAGLIASSLLRRNPLAKVVPFEGRVVPLKISAKATVLNNTKLLASVGGGSTDCAAALAHINASGDKVDVVVFVSDYESWTGNYGITRGTQMSAQWEVLKRRNPTAKLVCIDLTPHNTTQVINSPDIFNVGGFSDNVFKMVDAFVTGSSKGQWVDVIESVEL